MEVGGGGKREEKESEGILWLFGVLIRKTLFFFKKRVGSLGKLGLLGKMMCLSGNLGRLGFVVWVLGPIA